MRVDSKLSPELGTSLVHWFDSPAEFALAADAGSHDYSGTVKWTGGTWEEAVRWAVRGQTSLVAAAEALLGKIGYEVETPSREWVPARAGSIPSVPHALAGYPDSMRRLAPSSAPTAPVRVFVDTMSSASFSAREVADRGTAVLALAMALSASRPTELHAFSGWGGARSRCVCVARIKADPLDLASACNALTSATFPRVLAMAYCIERRFGTSWMFGYYPDKRERARYVAQAREILDAAPTDVIVPPSFTTDSVVRDPVEFVRRSLAELAEAGEA